MDKLLGVKSTSQLSESNSSNNKNNSNSSKFEGKSKLTANDSDAEVGVSEGEAQDD